jgi:WD40 repeat protein
VLTAGQDGTVRLWLPGAVDAELVLRGQTSIARDAVMSGDGRYVASVGFDGTVRVWATRLPRILPAAQTRISDLEFAPKGPSLVAGAADGTVRIWRGPRGAGRTLRGHRGVAYSVEYSPDGRAVLTSGKDGTIRAWRVPDGEQLHKIQVPGGGWLLHVAIDSAGRRIATAASDGRVRVLRWPQGSLVETLGPPASGRAPPRGLGVFSVDFLGEESVVSGHGDGKVLLWHLASGDRRLLGEHGNRVYDVNVSPNGHHVVSASQDGTVRVWRSRGGSEAVLRGHEGGVASARFSPDGRFVVSAGVDGTTRLWAWQQQTPSVLLARGRYSAAATFDRSGKHIAIAQLGSVQILPCAACLPTRRLLGRAQHQARLIRPAFR